MKMMMKGVDSLFFLCAAFGAQALQPLPPPQSSPAGELQSPSSSNHGHHAESDFSLAQVVPRTIYITAELAGTRDSEGLTLIPPSGKEFAETFVEDLAEVTGHGGWDLRVVQKLPEHGHGIFLDLYGGDAEDLTYESGEPTEEGYKLDVSRGRAVVYGAGARGMFWGTRTLLQQVLLSGGGGSVKAGSFMDAPAYASRGFLLDAGRKWYAPSFLKDLCTYESFFKMSEFHYHMSDNYPLSRGHNETWQDVYAQFSLHPESEDLQGLVQRANETLDRDAFEDLQQHCARRGVTVIPEIEAPGHCLTITKWKPELAIDKKDLLNLTHPDSIPTVKKIWDEFLPWFQTKEVHIGADEYDSTLADDYIQFVNEMEDYIKETSGKRIRIWGTYEPSENSTISKDIIVQHWQYGQSDPVQLQDEGYDLINSQDWWAYMSLKNDHSPIYPATYPQFYNETRTLNFADEQGWQWEPSLFNNVNTSEQLKPGASGLKGALLAAWNDNGPDPTTQLEAYYAIRRGIPLVAARAWSGVRGPAVDATTFDQTVDFLSPRVPGANLDRTIEVRGKQNGDNLISWERGHHKGQGDQAVTLGYGSKGMNYTLQLSVTGPFELSSPDATLTLTDAGSLVFNSDGWEYPLRSVDEDDGFDPGMPGRIWANTTSSTHEPVTVSMSKLPVTLTVTGDVIGGSRVWVDDKFAGRFEAFVFGGQNLVTSWSQMAFVAPLQTLKGEVQKLVLKGRVEEPRKNKK